ncbi:MAG: hypothetical protein M1471_01315 [Patescibacteria group bacterium]|nr:hypothetical protein [Patescibacteria group bacterium]
MFYNFLLQIVMMAALAAVVYIASRVIPRIDDEIAAPALPNSLWWERAIKKIPLDKIDGTFNRFVEKTLRKLKIVIMKADNAVTGKLKGFKSENGKKNGDGGLIS